MPIKKTEGQKAVMRKILLKAVDIILPLFVLGYLLSFAYVPHKHLFLLLIAGLFFSIILVILRLFLQEKGGIQRQNKTNTKFGMTGIKYEYDEFGRPLILRNLKNNFLAPLIPFKVFIVVFLLGLIAGFLM